MNHPYIGEELANKYDYLMKIAIESVEKESKYLSNSLFSSDIKKKIRNYFIVVKLLFHIVCYTENVHESITTGYERPDAAC